MSDSVAPSHPSGGGFDLTRLPQRSFGLKLLLVCLLAVLMAVPAGFVWMLAYSRSSDAFAASEEVIAMRGGPQELMGPVIVVPFERDILSSTDGSVVQTIPGRMTLYADKGEASALVRTELRRRGLHDVPVFTAPASFTATFDPAHVAAEAPKNARIKWADARVYMSLSVMRAI